MTDNESMIGRFEEHQSHLHAVAHRMLGSASAADDAVQEAWVRFNRSDTAEVENLGGWLTTVVARVCLNVLRARNTRREDSLDAVCETIVWLDGEGDPERETVLVDSISSAMSVVVEQLAPAERVAFVLHDAFAIPFDEIATILDRSEPATRQLASRARKRVRGATASLSPDLPRHRRVVDAFFAAARHGDFGALMSVLDPDVTLQADLGALNGGTVLVHGAELVAGRATMFADPARVVVPAIVNGAVGVMILLDHRPVSVMAFDVVDDKVVQIRSNSDPERMAVIAEDWSER